VVERPPHTRKVNGSNPLAGIGDIYKAIKINLEYQKNAEKVLRSAFFVGPGTADY
jgi:hypothetical protein